MATRTNTIKTNIEANSEQFLNAMKEIKRSMTTVRTEFKSVNEIMKDTGYTVDDLTAHKKYLSKEIIAVEANLKVLKSGLSASLEKEKNFSDAIKNNKDVLDENGEKIKDLNSALKSQQECTRITREEVNKAEAQYYSLKNQIKLIDTELEKHNFSLKKVSDAFGNLSEVSNKFAQKVRWLSVGASSLLGLSTKTAIDFEDAFIGVKKTVEGTDEQLEQIRKDIIELSNVIPISTTELFNLAQEAGQLGIASENITVFTETMAKLGSATNLSAIEAGEAIAEFVNVMGTLPENYERIGSTIVKLGNNSKATESDIVSMAQRMSGAAATIKMSEADVLGLATALSSVGLEAEMGGTAISRIMNDFNRAASGVETKYGTLSQYAKICGMSVKEFAKTVKNDAGEAIQQFVVGLGDSNRTGKETIRLMSELGINEVRLTDTMLRLANASGTVEEYMTMANDEWVVNNALNEEASKKFADTASKAEITKNKLAELADKFGQLVLPTFNNTLDKVGKLVDWFGNLDVKTQKTIIKFTTFAALLLPVSKGISGVTKSFSEIVLTIDKIQKSEKLIGLFKDSWSKLSGVVVKAVAVMKPAIMGLFTLITSHPIVAGITVAIGAIILLWNKCEWFRNLVINVFSVIKDACSKAWETIKGVFSVAWNFIKKIWEPVAKFFSDIWNKAKDGCSNAFEKIKNFVSTAWDFIKKIWEPVAKFFSNIWNKAKDGCSNAFEKIKNFVSTAWDFIKKIWQPVAKFFSNIWNKAKDGCGSAFEKIKDFVSKAWESIKKVFEPVTNFFSDVWNYIIESLKPVIDSMFNMFHEGWLLIKVIWDYAVGFFSGIWEGIKDVFGGAVEILSGFFSNAWENIQNVWNKVTGFFSGIFEGIKNIFDPLAKMLSDFFSSAWENIKNVWNKVTGFFSGIFEGIKNIFDPLAKILSDFFSSAWENIKNVWNKVTEFFSGIFEGIKNIFDPLAKMLSDLIVRGFAVAWAGIKIVWDVAVTYFQIIWEGIKNVFSIVGTVLGAMFANAWTIIKGVWDVAVAYFQLVWTGIKNVFSVVATVIGGAFKVAFLAIKAVWDTVTSYFKTIFDTIAGIFATIRNVLTGNFSEAWESVKGIVNTWTEYFQGIWNSISEVFGGVVNYFKDIFGSAWNAIKNVFSGVGTFFGSMWATIKETFTNIGQKIGETMSTVFKKAVNGLLSSAEKVLNLPIKAINAAVGVINTLPGVSITKISEFNLPRLAKGAVLDKGARAVIAGEAGAEAIVPLENNTKWINKVADKFKETFSSTMNFDRSYYVRNDHSIYIENQLSSIVDILENILRKPNDVYLDSQKISKATASSDDTVSGDLLERLERGWVI